MEYSLKFSQQDIVILIQGLGKLPLELSYNVFSNLQQQVNKQDSEKAIPIDSLTPQNK